MIQNNNICRRFDFKRADYINLNNYLLGVDWYSLLTDTCDVNLQWERFTEVLNAGMEMYVGVGHFRHMSISGHAISVHKFSVQSTSVHEMSFSVQVNFGT